MVQAKHVAAMLVFGLSGVPALLADDVQYVEENGSTKSTRQVVQRPINETRYEPREYTTYKTDTPLTCSP